MDNRKKNKKNEDKRIERQKLEKGKKIDYNLEELMSDGMRFTTAEILDIAEGVDSDI